MKAYEIDTNLLPLYFVTTAELMLWGSWKVTVSDVLLVTIRQMLVGASGAPANRGKTLHSMRNKYFSNPALGHWRNESKPCNLGELSTEVACVCNENKASMLMRLLDTIGFSCSLRLFGRIQRIFNGTFLYVSTVQDLEYHHQTFPQSPRLCQGDRIMEELINFNLHLELFRHRLCCMFRYHLFYNF